MKERQNYRRFKIDNMKDRKRL